MTTKTNPCPLCDAHGYVEDGDLLMLDALTCAYQKWLDAQALPQVSMDEHDLDTLTRSQLVTLSQFEMLWNSLTDEVAR